MGPVNRYEQIKLVLNEHPEKGDAVYRGVHFGTDGGTDVGLRSEERETWGGRGGCQVPDVDSGGGRAPRRWLKLDRFQFN